MHNLSVGSHSVREMIRTARLARSDDRFDDKPDVLSCASWSTERATSRLLGSFLRRDQWARENGVNLVEAYPIDKVKRFDDDGCGSVESMYDNAGFVEVARRKPTRPVFARHFVQGGRLHERSMYVTPLARVAACGMERYYQTLPYGCKSSAQVRLAASPWVNHHGTSPCM